MLDPLLSVTREDGELALMVKPQFEVGKDRVGKGGVGKGGGGRGVRHGALRSVGAEVMGRGAGW